MLSTGLASDAAKQINWGREYWGADFTPLNSPVGDAALLVISFDVASSADVSISFSYVFASAELPIYGGSPYNDDMDIRLNGKSIARLSDGQDLTINALVPSKSDSSSWSNDYVNNSCPGGVPFAYTGYTTVLTAKAGTMAGQQNILEIEIMDVGDGKMDSALFLEANTLVSVAGGGAGAGGASLSGRYSYGTTEWTGCSTTCGVGEQSRQIFCGQVI